MRCKKCDKSRSASVKNIICWRDYNLCPICMSEDYPDFYDPRVRMNWLSRRYEWAKSDKPKNRRVRVHGEL